MRLFSVALAAASVSALPDMSDYPSEIFMCNNDHQHNIPNGKMILKDVPNWTIGPTKFYQHQNDHLAILFSVSLQKWIITRQHEKGTGYYHFDNPDDLFALFFPWHVYTGNEGEGNPDEAANWELSSLRLGTTEDCNCATFFDEAGDSKSLTVPPGENKNMKKIDGVRWTNKVSAVNVAPGCNLKSFNRYNFKKLLGTFNSWIDTDSFSTTSHIFSSADNNKMSSYMCECSGPPKGECELEFFGPNGGPPTGPPDQCKTKNVRCNEATFSMIDAWEQDQNGNKKYSMMGELTIPDEYKTNEDFTVALRLESDNLQANIGSSEQQILNVLTAVDRKNLGKDIVYVFNKHTAMKDVHNKNKFLIRIENMNKLVLPKVFFWHHRETKAQCMNDRSTRSNDFERAVAANPDVNSPADVGTVMFRPNGVISVKP